MGGEGSGVTCPHCGGRDTSSSNYGAVSTTDGPVFPSQLPRFHCNGCGKDFDTEDVVKVKNG